jgi:energy-coupling factor transport system substrate-specific component
VRIWALAAYGVLAGYLFGALMNLWSWPFLTAGTAVSWSPDATAAENLRHYATFYAATSFVWDTFRAVGNGLLVVVLGRPLLGALDRAARRMRLEVRDDMSVGAVAPPTTEGAVDVEDPAAVLGGPRGVPVGG